MAERKKLYKGEEYQMYFSPEDYCNLVYRTCAETGTLEEPVKFLTDFYHDLFSSGKYKGTRLIDVCSGPAIHSVISASKYYKDIYLSDYTDNNRSYVKKWLAREEGAFDWTNFFAYAATREGSGLTGAAVEERVRSAIRDVAPCNLLQEEIFGTRYPQLDQVDAITSSLTLESAATDHDCYRNIVRKLGMHLAPQGLFTLVGVLNTTYYSTGGNIKFFSLNVDLEFVKSCLEEARMRIIDIKSLSFDEHDPDMGDTNGFFALYAVKE